MGRYFWNDDIHPVPTPQEFACLNIERGFSQIEVAIAVMDREAAGIEQRITQMREVRQKNALGNHEKLSPEEVKLQIEFEEYFIDAETRLHHLRESLDMVRRVCAKEPQSAHGEAKKQIMRIEHSKRVRSNLMVVK